MPRRRIPYAALGLAAVVGCGGSENGPMEPGPSGSNDSPVAAFAVESTGSAAPVGASFDAAASTDADGQIVSYAWSFGDGSGATGVQVDHVFDEPGTYDVVLTVTDDEGATGTAQQSVEVTEPGPDQITGVVYLDADRDGMQGADEVGVPGMTVYLDADTDGELDDGETVTQTGVAGVYQFSGLSPGTYRVTQELGIGWTNTSPGPAVPPAGGPARILGGDDAPAGVYPFMASIQIASEPDPQEAHICGGSLIAPQFVLTASHCLSDNVAEPFPPDALEILLGTHLLDGSGVRVPVDTTYINPGYSPAGGFYQRDISLVKLSQRFDDTPRVFLMDSAAFTANVEPSDRGTLIGWGALGEAIGIPVELQIAEIPLRPDSDCVEYWNADMVERFDGTMLCVGHIAGSPDSCFGDSGGPWMFELSGRLHQLGAVSWGPIPCGRPSIPSAYASVPAMLAFVESIVPREPSGFVEVTLGGAGARADFGNFH